MCDSSMEPSRRVKVTSFAGSGMSTRERVGLLLINLGTPESPKPADVRTYLREFLSDPRVIDVGALQRWLVLNLLILPFRPRRSAEAYEKIWTERGSPLLFHDLTVLPSPFFSN